MSEWTRQMTATKISTTNVVSHHGADAPSGTRCACSDRWKTTLADAISASAAPMSFLVRNAVTQ